MFDSRHVRILHSSFRHNAHVGIKPVGTTNSVIKGNLVSHNGDEGFLMEGGERLSGQGATASFETAPASPSAPAAIT